jgi:hypothetical protein
MAVPVQQLLLLLTLIPPPLTCASAAYAASLTAPTLQPTSSCCTHPLSSCHLPEVVKLYTCRGNSPHSPGSVCGTSGWRVKPRLYQPLIWPPRDCTAGSAAQTAHDHALSWHVDVGDVCCCTCSLCQCMFGRAPALCVSANTLGTQSCCASSAAVARVLASPWCPQHSAAHQGVPGSGPSPAAASGRSPAP